jgi:N-acetylmuramic acid-specific PTS system IIC component
MFLAAIFIFAVLFGIHQGFIPIYVALIGQPGSGGINTLFPVLALAGTTQVGATLCLYMLAPKKSLFRKEAIGVIIPGIFGVGEPIIYGITLPRFVPLISGAIAAAVPGFVLGAINA